MKIYPFMIGIVLPEKKVRIDKWLWAARFFKTRSMASKAVSGGRVHVNGGRVKSAKNVNVGDTVRIHRNEVEFVVTVLQLADKRGPAKVAQTLYVESSESIQAREIEGQKRRLLFQARPVAPAGRPGKRDRRKIRNFIRKD